AFVVGIMRPTGTDLEESLRYNSRMEKLLLQEFPDEVEHVWSRCGTAEVATDPMGTEETDFFITLRPRHLWVKVHTQVEMEEQLRKLFGDLPGQRLSYTQPIGQRVDEMISGVKSAVAVKISGDDFEVLRAKAAEVQAVLSGIPGAQDIKVEQI